MPTYRKSDQKFRFRSFRGASPTTEEIREELENVVDWFDRELEDLVQQLNERDATVVSLQEQVADLTARVEALEASA